MYQHEIDIRVRYAETDKMGFVYYGNYATYLEVARVEMLRSLGVSYKSLEDEGVLLPVRDFNIQYLKPGHYDDELLIVTSISEMPTARIRFTYDIMKGSSTVIAKAETVLVFVNAASGKPLKCPDKIIDSLQSYF